MLLALAAVSTVHVSPAAGQSTVVGSTLADPFYLINSRPRMTIANPPATGNFSGVTYSPLTDSLFVVDNGVSHIYEFDLNGLYRRTITTTGFDDAEGIVWMGGDQFGFLEEKTTHINVLTIGPTTTSINKALLPLSSVIRPDLDPSDPSKGSLNPTGGNTGLEGLAYDPLLDRFYVVKEKAAETPGDYGINVFAVERSGLASVLFNPSVAHGSSQWPLTGLGTDVADVHFDPTTRNLFILSQESRRVIEVTLAGEVLGYRDLTGTQIEGVAFTPDRKTMFVVGESREFFRYESSPQIAALIQVNSVWKYRDDGLNQGVAWRERTFDDSTWSAGPAELGYGDVDERTTIRCGPSLTCVTLNDATKYFRHEFSVSNPHRIEELTLGLQRDDGAAVYLNGVEIYRDASLLPDAAYNHFANRLAAVNDPEEDFFVYVAVQVSLLRSSGNVLAVEVHQFSATDLDLSFNAQLIARYAVLPEPSSAAIAATALLAAGFARFRRRR
ncbi:MAG: SdiA-regulated domain-containing protein [Pirellulales bacterium]